MRQRCIRATLAIGLAIAAMPVAAQDAEAVLHAKQWEACLIGGRAGSLAETCAVAATLPGLSEREAAMALALRGNALAASGDWATAFPELTRALALHPGEPTARLVRGIALVERGEFEQGIADLSAFLALSPGHTGALNARAIGYVRTGRPAAAVADFTEALKEAPHHPSLLHNRANAMRDAGQIEQAVREYDRLLLLGRSARLLGDRCLARLVRGDIRLAQADCEAAVEMAPNDAGLIENRGLVLLKWNQPERALADFNEALAIRADLPWALYARGLVRARRGDAQRGAADVRAAQALDPKVGEQLARFGIRP